MYVLQVKILFLGYSIFKLQSWTNALGQYSILSFKSLFITYSGFFCNPLPPFNVAWGKIVCRAESGPVYAQR